MHIFLPAEMEIKSAKASDSGLWTCLSGSSKVLDEIKLLVIPRFASGPFLFQMGNILSNSSVIIAKEGEPLQLICVSRDPEALLFDLNGREIRGHKIPTHLASASSEATVTYKMLNKTGEKSMHNVSCGSTLVKIEVHYPPSFTIRREPQFGIPIVEGMTVLLGCDVDSHPPTNASGWLKNEKPSKQLQGPTLILSNADIKDVGWYQCTTRYDGESVSSIGYFLNVHPPETFQDDNEDESLSETHQDTSHGLGMYLTTMDYS